MTMPMSVPVGTVVQMDWHSTAEGETVLQHFYNPQTSGRKLFGVLERPLIAPNIEEVSYKLFFCGKAGVGKTATIARLAGTSVTHAGHVETSGIRKTNVYWPVKIWDKIILFKLQCWDAGENTIKKYSHILPSCKSKSDAIIFLFSFMDKASFIELPQLISKYIMNEESNRPAVIVVGTRFSVTSKVQVTMAEVKEFEHKWCTHVLKMNKYNTVVSNDRNEVHKMAPVLNMTCEKLWIRDQEYLLKNGLTV